MHMDLGTWETAGLHGNVIGFRTKRPGRSVGGLFCRLAGNPLANGLWSQFIGN